MITVVGIQNKLEVGHINEAMVSLMFDKLEELSNLPTLFYQGIGDIAVHSMALCNETGKVYSLSGNRVWTLVGGQ